MCVQYTHVYVHRYAKMKLQITLWYDSSIHIPRFQGSKVHEH